MASRTIPHVAPALAELAVTIGALDPADRRTQATLIPIVEMLTRISPTPIVAPSYEVWLEAAVMAGILARTQAIPSQYRRKFLNAREVRASEPPIKRRRSKCAFGSFRRPVDPSDIKTSQCIINHVDTFISIY